MARSLRGKTLFITGASRGIGKAIALRAARDGANVVIAAKTEMPHPTLPGTIASAAEDVRGAGGQGLAVKVDVRDEAQIGSAVAKAVATFGGIDILVNNASAIQLTPTTATPMNRFDLMFDVNVACQLRLRSSLPAASGQGAQSAHLESVAAAQHGSEVVQGPPRLHDVQVRHEHVRAGPGRRAGRQRHRRERACGRAP